MTNLRSIVLFLFPTLVLLVSLCSAANEEGLAGGFSPLNAADYTDKAWKAVPEINGKNNGQFYLVPVKVLKAQVQVVAGTNTELEVLVAESSCSKSVPVSQIKAANCAAKTGGAQAVYKVSIWEKSWENFEQITAEKIRDV